MGPAALTVWLGLSLGSAGHAGPSLPLAYFGLRTLGVDEATAERLDAAIQAELAGASRFEVEAAPRPGFGPECESATRCYCESARGLGKSRALWGNTAAANELYTFELVLLDTQDCTIDNSVFVAEEHDISSAQARMGALVRELVTPQETVTETAVKSDRNVERAPAIVTVITAKQLRQLGIAKVEEVFRLVPGFEIIDLNYNSRVLHHGISGTLLILVDGVPLHNSLVGFDGFGADLVISLNEIERVEFVRGPASVLWGTNALLGVVNFITKSSVTEELRVDGHLRYGTLDTQELAASISATQPNLRYTFATTVARSRGSRSFVENSLYAPEETDDAGNVVTPAASGNRGTTQNGYDEYLGLVGKVALFEILSLSLTYYDSKSRYQLSPRGSLLPPKEQGFWDKSHLLYRIEVQDELPFGLGYRAFVSRHELTFWEKFVFYPANEEALPTGLFFVQGNETDPVVNHLAEASLHHDLTTDYVQNEVMAGVAYLNQVTPDVYVAINDGLTPGPLELDLESQELVTTSVFIQDDLSILDGLLSVSGGLRYDHHDPGPAILNKQAGLMLDSRWVSAKLLYTEGFRSPTVNDRFSSQGIKGQRGLAPEKSRQVAAQVTGWVLDYGELRVGGSVAKLFDLIRINRENPPDGFFGVPENGDEIDIRSAFVEGRLRLGSDLSGLMTYAYKDVEESRPVGSGIPLAHHTAAVGLSWRPFNDVSLAATGSFVSARSVDALDPADREVRLTLHQYYLLDVAFTLSNLLDTFDFSLRLVNPFGFAHWSPMQITGNVNPLVERRMVREILATLSWSI